MANIKRYKTKQAKRKARIRGKLQGVSDRPRLSVNRSNKHISAQIIDDTTRKTLVHVSDASLKTKGTKTEAATSVGEAIAKIAIDKKITKVTFDRGSYRYHGRVKALAQAAREKGLIF